MDYLEIIYIVWIYLQLFITPKIKNMHHFNLQRFLKYEIFDRKCVLKKCDTIEASLTQKSSMSFLRVQKN